MKKYLLSFLTVVFILSLAGFQGDNSGTEVTGIEITGTEASDSVLKERLPEPEFPLSEDVIKDALDELGLDWVIPQDEIQQVSKENVEGVIHVFRDPVKTQYEYSTSPLLYGGVSSGFVEGKRHLSISFDSRGYGLYGAPFAWEDWKQGIILGTMLYGGFEDKEEVYRALSELEVSDDDSIREWEVSLSKGYCWVHRSSTDRNTSEEGYYVWINFFESEEDYQKDKQKREEIRKQTLREMSEGTKKRLMWDMDEEARKKFQQEIDEANQMEAGD
ncbi:hypothetical protein NXH76_22705 [Blautia schinkii]|nr:hypothetical protein [Blautia schinkii]